MGKRGGSSQFVSSYLQGEISLRGYRTSTGPMARLTDQPLHVRTYILNIVCAFDLC